MYLPKHFAEARAGVLHSAIAAHPLATLVSLSSRGVEADLLPLVLRPQLGVNGELHGHVARANPLWRDHPVDADLLAVFSGAQTYISPNWYPSKKEHGKVVPTWNYITVQARGRLRVMDDRTWTRTLVETLTTIHESDQPVPWKVSDAPADYIEKMLGAIVGIVIEITELTGKWKVSQNQSAENRAGIVSALASAKDEAARAVGYAVAGTRPTES